MTSEQTTIGFIGFGNMAQAMAQGLVNRGGYDGNLLYATAAHFDKLQRNTAELGMHACKTVQQVAEASDFVVLAVKPHMIAQVIEPVREELAHKAVISVAAGCNFDFYEKVLAPGSRHLSTIPNTPISVGAGIFACEKRHSLTQDEFETFVHIFEPVALIEMVDTSQLSTAGTIAGCAPAFTAMYIEALADAGVKHGLSRATAYRLASQMIVGTGKLQLETGAHPGAMKDAVCSPGGTTIKGVSALEKSAFRGAVIGAIDAIEG